MSRFACRVIARVPVSSTFYLFSRGGSHLQYFCARICSLCLGIFSINERLNTGFLAMHFFLILFCCLGPCKRFHFRHVSRAISRYHNVHYHVPEFFCSSHYFMFWRANIYLWHDAKGTRLQQDQSCKLASVHNGL